MNRMNRMSIITDCAPHLLVRVFDELNFRDVCRACAVYPPWYHSVKPFLMRIDFRNCTQNGQYAPLPRPLPLTLDTLFLCPANRPPAQETEEEKKKHDEFLTTVPWRVRDRFECYCNHYDMCYNDSWYYNSKYPCLPLSAVHGHLTCLRYARERLGMRWEEVDDPMICSQAAKGGHLNCLTYAHENGCPWDELTCACAAWNGHLHCMEYAYDRGAPLYAVASHYAAFRGHLHCLRYAVERGAPWQECNYAAKGGHLHCLEYAKELGTVSFERACEDACVSGSLECLIFCHVIGGDQQFGTEHDHSCHFAALYDNLDCLRYARETGGSPCTFQTLINAARGGSVACLRYLVETVGMPLEKSLLYDACGHDRETVDSNGNGHAECAKYICEKGGFAADVAAITLAAREEDVECMRECIRHLPEPSEQSIAYEGARHVCRESVRNWDLDCLRCARENGRFQAPWDEYTSVLAVNRGVKHLRYLHENGCPWDARTCAMAAYERDVECLAYAHENGCPWDEYTRYFAEFDKYADDDEEDDDRLCSEYCRSHGAPYVDPQDERFADAYKKCFRKTTDGDDFPTLDAYRRSRFMLLGRPKDIRDDYEWEGFKWTFAGEDLRYCVP